MNDQTAVLMDAPRWHLVENTASRRHASPRRSSISVCLFHNAHELLKPQQRTLLLRRRWRVIRSPLWNEVSTSHKTSFRFRAAQFARPWSQTYPPRSSDETVVRDRRSAHDGRWNHFHSSRSCTPRRMSSCRPRGDHEGAVHARITELIVKTFPAGAARHRGMAASPERKDAS